MFCNLHQSNRIGMFATVVVAGLFSVTLHADEPVPQAASADDLAFFEKQVRPLLVQRCFECHSADAKSVKGGLRLDHTDGWLAGGDSGQAVIPGKPEESLLVETVHYAGEMKMPPSGKLPEQEIAILVEWVRRGAPAPQKAASHKGMALKPAGDVANWAEARKFWAFRQIDRPARPAVREASWPRGAIDHFVLNRLEQEGFVPAGDADPVTLRRRLAFDLTGLPPTGLAESLSYDECVDRLLAAPEFGEHWARHWLDLVCFADTIDSAQMPLAHAWRYRDYVIESLNADKPFDQFIREQLAGDLLPAASDSQRREQIIATGFLALGPWALAEQDKERLRMDIVDHQINLIGRTFLGLSLECARCHSHKFDPIPHRDYYALAGIFGSGEVIRGLWRSNLSAPVLAELPETDDEREARLAAMPEWEAEFTAAETRRRELQEAHERLLVATPTDAVQISAAKKALDEQDATVRFINFQLPSVPLAHAFAEAPTPADCRINRRGDPNNLGDAVPRGFLTIVATSPMTIPPHSSGRLELAEWLVAPENPLTPRVLANRVWQHLNGEGLVRSVDYFGVLGERPSHPELLDHLATRFREERWSLKQLIREIVLSRTYRLAAVGPGAQTARDPENRLLWRANRRRLTGEMLRDTLLLAAGELSDTRGGPALRLDIRENLSPGDPVNPPTVNSTMKLTDEHLRRRTIYLPLFRQDQNLSGELEVLAQFDFPSTSLITGHRAQTSVPTQSLFLMNSPFILKRSDAIARRVLLQESAEPALRIDFLWNQLLSREPTPAEMTIALNALGDSPATDDWTTLARSLIATNSFLFRD